VSGGFRLIEHPFHAQADRPSRHVPLKFVANAMPEHRGSNRSEH
jgi:hypothetical protein